MGDLLAARAIEDGDDDTIRSLLEEVCAVTDMGFAAVARVTEDRWIACQVHDKIEFGLKPGEELAVQTTICNEIREHRGAVVFDDALADEGWRTHPVPILYGFRSYASFPIVLADGAFYSTLCAIDPSPRSLSAAAVVTALRACAERVAAHLASRPGVGHEIVAYRLPKDAWQLL